MEFINEIMAKAKAVHKKIVLPEGYDVRLLQAAQAIHQHAIADIVILGEPDEIAKLAKENHVDLSGISILHPITDPHFEQYAQKLYEKRKEKGMSLEDARKILHSPDNLYYAGMLLKAGVVDGCVAGAANTTGDVIRAAIHTVGMREGINRVSSSIFVVTENKSLGESGVLLMADVAVNPDPDAQCLGEIAVISANTYQSIIGKEAKVAMLSFSTKGSAEHPDIDKVREATAIAQKLAPNLKIDGELQIDPALDPHSARKKAPNSSVAGQANVLIFPDLGSANIGSKMPQVIGGARPIGPLVQGIAAPFNDLSRNCSVDDAIILIGMTCLMAG